MIFLNENKSKYLHFDCFLVQMAIYYIYYFVPCTYHLQYILELILYQCIRGSEPYSGNVPVIVYFTHFDFLKFLFIFGCAGSLLLCGLFSHCGEQATLQLWCVGFSLWLLLLLWSMVFRTHRLSSCGSWALEHTLNNYGTQA